jgi:hypothetical protein
MSHRTAGSRVLDRYLNTSSVTRELVAVPGAACSVLIVDRDAATLTDGRLVAHLGADEPLSNQALICARYLEDRRGRWCRPVQHADLEANPIEESRLVAPDASELDLAPGEPALSDARGCSYTLGVVAAQASIPQLRWCRSPACGGQMEILTLRDVVGALESYEPVMSATATAIGSHRPDPEVSVVVLAAELQRMQATRIVLNRALREAVLRAVREQGLSMSEIAMRCGRAKRDARGMRSGETSWLGRRLGLLPESGARNPTPWVHSEVLGLIARKGLGISPREVELG